MSLGNAHKMDMRLILFVACFASLHAGALARSATAVREYRAAHACPTTARHRGPCPGFQVDHVRALCAGGEDLATNMQWLSLEDHRWKTFVDVRECRKLRRGASRPAQ